MTTQYHKALTHANQATGFANFSEKSLFEIRSPGSSFMFARRYMYHCQRFLWAGVCPIRPESRVPDRRPLRSCEELPSPQLCDDRTYRPAPTTRGCSGRTCGNHLGAQSTGSRSPSSTARRPSTRLSTCDQAPLYRLSTAKGVEPYVLTVSIIHIARFNSCGVGNSVLTRNAYRMLAREVSSRQRNPLDKKTPSYRWPQI
jgi:hypothetical protein